MGNSDTVINLCRQERKSMLAKIKNAMATFKIKKLQIECTNAAGLQFFYPPGTIGHERIDLFIKTCEIKIATWVTFRNTEEENSNG